MPDLVGQNILIGVTGGVAAYKSPDLVRRLVERGAIVKVVMTPSATQFISPLTMHAVSGQPVFHTLIQSNSETAMDHIELARWADKILVAPTTANFITKLAIGLADDLLSTLCLATEAEIAIAPAMNHMMWKNPATQKNITTLQARGISILGPDTGDQACGETGPGRMIELNSLLLWFSTQLPSQSLSRLNVLVTAGPTWEALDPIRGLTNHSSGKMGYAIATAALKAGAKVTLVSGPTKLAAPRGVSTYHVTTAEEMLNEVEKHVHHANIFVGVAAVSDYRPRETQHQKIKKSDTSLQIELVRNPDILATVADRSSPPFTVGFSAETTNLITNTRSKLREKQIDLMVANHVGGEENPFGHDYNTVSLVDNQTEMNLLRESKQKLAETLIREIASRYYEKSSTTNP